MSVIQPTSLRLVKALDTGLQIYTLNWKQLPQHMQMTVNVSSSVSLSFVKQFEHLKKHTLHRLEMSLCNTLNRIGHCYIHIFPVWTIANLHTTSHIRTYSCATSLYH